ncbi:hypothetical protein, partial [Salmonella enterica]|uniref:hypothetical protein n=1 Tax=Salmonella enterica TaxID=28901 RepID=UPI003CC7FAC5
ADFTDDKFGVPTVSDIIKELEKPGRDPRPEFKTAQYAYVADPLPALSPSRCRQLLPRCVDRRRT